MSSFTDVPLLPTTRVYPEDLAQKNIVHTQTYTQIAQAVNARDIGTYFTSEVINGQTFFTSTPQVGSSANLRDVYRKVFIFGATAAGATTVIAHGITGFTQFTRIYGTCITDVVDYRPIPYASATAVNTQIELKVGAANISVINGAAAPNITSGLIVLEYLKS